MKEVNIMSKYKYKFTVIVPVYKVEEYLSETLDSVIAQDIGFKENIQIVIVNDGSPDNSEKICLEYAEKYPENIKYVYQDNAGVSAARNNGLNYVEGKYINFLDSDDKWEKDVFTKAWKMFESHDEIDVIGVRQKFFEAANGYPSLDYKFDEDKVVDIFNYYDHIQLSVTSGFYRTSAIGDIRYDTRVKYSEDAKFINEIIMQKCKIGIIASSVHLYRKRFSENSAIQVKNFRDDWYIQTPELCYEDAFELSKKKFGYIIPYAQYYVAYDYQWRIKEPIPSVISQEVIDRYMKTSKKLLSQIDDQILLRPDRLTPELKIELLKFKYGEEVANNLEYRNHCIEYNNIPIYNLLKNNIMEVTIFETNKEKIKIKGLVHFNVPSDKYEIYAVINQKERIKIELKDTKIKERKFFNQTYMTARGFEVEIPRKNFNQMYFVMIYDKHYETIIKFLTGPQAKISSKTKVYYNDGRDIFYYYNKRIKSKKNNLKNRLYMSTRNTKFNLQNFKLKTITIRALYSLLKLFKRKELWIITDRQNVANDNGYALFKHLSNNKVKNTKVYFAITKNSKDLEKVKKTGKYLYYNSLKYKISFLLADKIISSQADEWTDNPFGKNHNYYHDLYKNKFIFLQHGIIKDDLSTWLNQYEKNMKIFVTSTKDEYNSIIKGKYGFKEDVVKLTGLPRYDLLESDPEKLIIFMPTWRTNLATGIDTKTGKRKKYQGFEKSEYCKFYNELINDEKLIKAMKEKGYKGLFVSHPCHDANINDFKGNDVIEISKKGVEYKELFSKGALLVTDYSSVVFDFVYLNKPIIYCQFDEEEFFKQQIYDKGYFDYSKHGFGPITRTKDDAVTEIIKSLKNKCELEKKYKERIEKTYSYFDKKNCERVIDEIKKL